MRSKPITVYLSGPMFECDEFEMSNWRRWFMNRYHGQPVVFRNPTVRTYADPLEECRELVNFDLNDIDESDILLAYCWKASWGTPMEIFYGSLTAKTVIIVVPSGQTVSPWVQNHGIIVRSLQEATVLLDHVLARGLGALK